jgi:hypothetical protein
LETETFFIWLDSQDRILCLPVVDINPLPTKVFLTLQYCRQAKIAFRENIIFTLFAI